MVSLGYNGGQQWLTGDAGALYGGRHDLIAMLKSANAPGRPYVLLTCDELAPGYYNFNNAPGHVIGSRTDAAKLGTYAKWVPLTDRIRPETIESEFYSYATPGASAELNKLVDDARIGPALEALLGPIINGELRAAMPASLRLAQALSKRTYLAHEALLADLPAPNSTPGFRPDLAAYGCPNHYSLEVLPSGPRRPAARGGVQIRQPEDFCSRERIDHQARLAITRGKPTD